MREVNPFTENHIKGLVQLVKDQIIESLEEMSEELLKKIVYLENERSAFLLKANYEDLMETLNEMKSQNERWMEQLYKQEEDNTHIIKKVQDCLSCFEFEKEKIFSFLLNKQFLETAHDYEYEY